MSEHTKTPWRVGDTIRRGYDTKQGGKYAFHEISSKGCCRGFWNRHKNLAQRLGFIEFVKVDKETE